MKIFNDTHQCECGIGFKWKTFFLQSDESWFGRWDEVKKNVINQTIINKQYHITVRCPGCGRKHFIVKE